MQAVLDELKQKPLGLSKVKKALPDFRVVLYDSLPASSTYTSIVQGKKGLVVLYQMHERGRPTDGMGHYALVHREGTRLLYFSSYGLGPEEEIAATHSKGRLLALLGKKYKRNTTQFQKRSHTATCGRWVILKARMLGVPLKRFVQVFSRRIQVDPDGLAVLSTMFLID